MAKTDQERSAAAAAKRAGRGETILRLPTLAGTRERLAELMAWHDCTEMADAMTRLIENAHALGRGGTAQIMSVPRHDYQISKRGAQAIEKSNRAEGLRLECDE